MSSAFSPNNLPILFAVVASLLGICFLTLMPAFQIPDEPAHFARAWSISSGRWVAKGQTTVPKSVEDIVVRWDKLRADPNVRPITGAEISEVMQIDVDRKSTIPVSYAAAANLYTPVPYLSEVAVFDIFRYVHLPVLVEVWLARLANLLSYVALTALAIHLLPDFRLHLFCVACLPMALHQAASLSADSLTLASSFLLAAYMLRVAFSAAVPSVGRRHTVRMLGCVLFASLCKFNIWPIFLFLLIPKEKFRTKTSRWLTLLGLLAATIAVAAIWNFVNYQNVQFFEVIKAQADKDIPANYRFAYGHPILLAHTLYNGIAGYWHWYLDMFVGDFAWLNFAVPDWILWEYMTLIAVVSVFRSGEIRLALQNRVVLAAVTIASLVSVLILLWGFEASPLDLRNAFSEHGAIYPAPGLQGRYLIPIAFPLTICLSKINLNNYCHRWLAFSATLFIAIANIEALSIIKHHFYC